MAEQVNCTIVSGSPINDTLFLKEKLDSDSFIIAADSGYRKLLDADIRIDCIVADFDSSTKPDIPCEMITFPIEKDATDTFNAVKLAVSRGYREIEIFFALGGRFDHSYANLLCLEYCRQHGVKCTLLDAQNRVSLIEDKTTVNRDYQAFSLFAFLRDCRGVTIKGAYYTAGFFGKEELDIGLADQFGQSNFVTDDVCEITVKEGTLLLIESNDG